MIVLDASVLIGHLDARDPHHEKATALLAESDAEPLGASAITLAETLVAPARTKRLKEAEAALKRLGVEELELGASAPVRLATLRAETGRKMPDCCVLAVAQRHEGSVASFDGDLRKAASKLGLDVVGG
ncbi:MAG TPA: type II toxin-antitoxin system VapC family toxin [Sphingomicrobium sp.]|nr:type II toxin-antitoxin system VapC family toxin [Sphingomicrobium sp.]